MVAVIIGREFAVTGLRSVAYARGLTMPASPLGKAKMVSQVVAILLLILGWERVPLLLLLGQAALWVVMATAFWSAADYYVRFNRAMGALTGWPTSRQPRPAPSNASAPVRRAFARYGLLRNP